MATFLNFGKIVILQSINFFIESHCKNHITINRMYKKISPYFLNLYFKAENNITINAEKK